ncbi:hypothetical protein BDF21DRAFT_459198 [Thamnidium elegans]|uniref:Uncharacterized protein n=1 Tax=Thamnidium elegans TaxID=101142 RepID=A0A8H7VT39_9FUNG|nr:hypothetical protein INT48_006792 [Thamnidium elegans]KAI8091505.1 hypothetical protein BDF21DRAFT_459198 [Thamnidium elegans]
MAAFMSLYQILLISKEVVRHTQGLAKGKSSLQLILDTPPTWAESCYFADYKSIESSLQHIPLHPLVGLPFFLIGKYRSLVINPSRSDLTIQKLYSIAKEIFENRTAEYDNLGEFLDVCLCANDQIKQGLTFLRVNTLDTNTKTQIKLSLMGASSILSKFQQNHSPPFHPSEVIRVASLQLNNVHHQELRVQSSVEDNQWTFTKNYINNHKSNTRTNNSGEPIPWEAIYRDGPTRGYFSTFANVNSTRTSFY